ncbi:hypothetical protein KY289_005050 [Solanum tuberosum]|nr:hypothetical protein KY289_005050 [Solanum tuberosum]
MVYLDEFPHFACVVFGIWLSGSDLKKVALFGCPSIAKKNVLSAKRLRTYFRIQEDNVCSKCALKASCKFVNQNLRKGDMANLHLAGVMRVITLYALESVPPHLVIPDEIKASSNCILNASSESDELISSIQVMNPHAKMGCGVESQDNN